MNKLIKNKKIFFVLIFLIHIPNCFSIPVKEGETPLLEGNREKPLSKAGAPALVDTSNIDLEGEEDSDVLKHLFVSLETSSADAIPSKLLVAAGALTEEERLEEAMSCGVKAAIVGVSVLSAICVSCVEATLTMLEIQNSIFGALFGVPEFGAIYPVLWGVGAATVGTALLKNYVGSKELNTWLVRSSSRYDSFSKEESHLKISTSAIVAVGLGFKPAFTLFDIIGEEKGFNNTPDYYPYPTNPLYEINIMDIFSVASVFWGAILVRESFLGARKVLDSLVRGIERSQRRGHPSERKKDEIRKNLAAGFRKLLKEPRAGYQLGLQVEKLQKEIEDRLEKLDAQIEEVKEKNSEPIEEEGVTVIDLLDKQLRHEQSGNLLMFRALVKFSEEGEHYHRKSNRKWSNAPKAFCDGHPGWYKGIYNLGRAIALAGSVPMWFGWVYAISEAFEASDETAFVFGSIMSAWFVPYMVEGTGEGLANVIARCANYNPIQGSDYVSAAVENINQGNCNRACRSMTDVMSLFSGGLVKIPAPFLGSLGMTKYISDDVFYSDNLIIFLFSLTSFAIVARNGSEGDFQGAITKLPCTRKNSVYAQQQKLVSLYKNTDKWVKGLYPDLIARLYEFLEQDLEGQLLRLRTF